MKLHPEDPRITAYVLGELDAEDAAAVEQAAAEDPAIQEKVREAGEIQRFLKERLAPPPATCFPASAKTSAAAHARRIMPPPDFHGTPSNPGSSPRPPPRYSP